MPQFLEKHLIRQRLNVSPDQLSFLTSWLSNEVDDADSSHKFLQAKWREALLRYEGVPKLETRDVPIENAPNIEVTIGAIASDTIYSQAVDLIFSIAPLVTVRPKPKHVNNDDLVKAAKALQTFVNHLASLPETNLRDATEDAILDDVQLGTGLLYVPWVKKHKKTKTAKILSQGPRIRAVALEDVKVPGGSRLPMDELDFFGISFYYTENQLSTLAKENNWDISNFQPLGGQNWVRQRREALAKDIEGVEYKGKIYEVINCYAYYDIDGDGLPEDLLIIYNHTGRAIGAYSFNPMDRRPVTKMVYQRRAHMFYGLGVLEMMGPYEEELTNVHNFSILNMLLANSRVWAGDGSVPDNLKIWPGKVINGLQDKDSLRPLQMADVYNSIWQEQMIIIQLANKRVGINEGISPDQVPNRTPGITTMSFLQQVNKRFSPAFDSMRFAISGALMQCLYRYQENLLAGNHAAAEAIFAVLGYGDGSLVINLLQNESFDEMVDVELTASSASVNREADRQNAMMLTNILVQYYQRTLELMMLASNPQTPPEVREIATRISSAASEIIDRTIRTFDQVRDPRTFVVEIEDKMKELEESGGSDQVALQQLVGALVAGGPQKQEEPKQLTMGGE
jgi:hypothetical protein